LLNPKTKGRGVPTSQDLKRSAAALALLLSAALPVGAESIEVLCTVHEWCEVAQRGFREATGIEVNMTELGSAKALERMTAQRDQPRYDVWFGGTGEFHLQAAKLKLTLPYRSPNNSLLHAWGTKFAEQSGYRTNGIFSGPLNLVYNTKVLASASVAPPRCWADLLKPEYKNLIQVGYPTGVYSVIATLVQLMGEDEAFAYLRKLHSNIKSYPRSGTDALVNVSKGEAGIVVAFVYGINADIASGPMVQMSTPCEGTGYEVGGMSIIKGGPNPNGAKRFFDWALTADAQKLMGQTGRFNLASNRNSRLDGRIVDSPSTRLVSYDFVKFGDLDERTRLLKKWQQTVDGGHAQ
jgi:iron(III) transport system substrate-binding protein